MTLRPPLSFWMAEWCCEEMRNRQQARELTKSKSIVTTLNLAQLDQLSINTIRSLSVDAVQKANSDHPGLPLGAAPMAYVLWIRFLQHNPANPQWSNRDRFVLSAGHGSMLLYSLLHLSGYDLPLNQIEQFRQWDSITPGHRERGLTPGVETTTGPLGQGFGNGVGMAIAEAYLAAQYNRPVALVLTRQDVPTLDRNRYASAEGLKRGANILAEAANGQPEVILIATGSEVNLIVGARQQLQKQDIQTRLVSMPSWELFDTQTEEYRRSVFPPSVRTRLAVEAGATQGWHRYIGEWGDVIGLDHFGASAPGPVLMREFGFTTENVCKRALALLEKNNA
jgi:transketolase